MGPANSSPRQAEDGTCELPSPACGRGVGVRVSAGPPPRMPAMRTSPDTHSATSPWTRALAAAGALFALTGVAAGAFGAHALKSRLPIDRLAVFETAVRYQLLHALALLACAWVLQTWPGRAARAAGACFTAGILLFSGSLYLLALLGDPRAGILTPFGGLGFLAGWTLLVAAILKAR
jgi:uncharacterized membrane protein YgdD (TMEM256/DUF423 family)